MLSGLLLPQSRSYAAASRWQVAKFSLQITATLIAQLSNRLFYLRQFSPSLQDAGFLTEQEAQISFWWYMTGLAVASRFVVVSFSRSPSIWKSVWVEQQDEKASNKILSCFFSASNPTKETSDIAGILTQHKALASITWVISLFDSFCSFPADTFFSVSCYRLFFNEGKYAPWWVYSVSSLVGLYDAKTYYHFRIPEVESSMVFLAELWKRRNDPNLPIDWKALKRNLIWSVYVGLTRGVITYFSAKFMMAIAAQWFSERTGLGEGNLQSVASAVSVLMASTSGFTNFNNCFFVGLSSCFTATSPTVQQSAESESLGRVAKTCVAAAASLCVVSTGYDYLLTVMSYYEISHPSEANASAWTQLAIMALFCIPITVYNYRFTAKKAIVAVEHCFAVEDEDDSVSAALLRSPSSG